MQPTPSHTRKALPAIKSPSTGHLRRGRSNAEYRSLLADIKLRISMGDEDQQIAEDLQLSTADYNSLKRELFRHATDELNTRTTEDVYLDYAWKQQRCVDELDDVINKMKLIPAVGTAATLVTAVRAKSEIVDKIIRTGQEMGVIEKAPERKMVLHGVAVAQLDNNQLRSHIAQELTGLMQVISRYGVTDMSGKPMAGGDDFIEAIAAVNPGPNFTENNKPGAAMGGTQKAAAARASRLSVRRNKVMPQQQSQG